MLKLFLVCRDAVLAPYFLPAARPFVAMAAACSTGSQATLPGNPTRAQTVPSRRSFLSRPGRIFNEAEQPWQPIGRFRCRSIDAPFTRDETRSSNDRMCSLVQFRVVALARLLSYTPVLRMCQDSFDNNYTFNTPCPLSSSSSVTRRALPLLWPI